MLKISLFSSSAQFLYTKVDGEQVSINFGKAAASPIIAQEIATTFLNN